ncbi:hypothetical protein ACP275_05G115200 [Erythranthe tilingii]
MGNCSLRATEDTAEGTTGGRKPPPLPPGNGVWKVKLVINPKDLERILSHEMNTEALIQQMRIAAYNSTPKRSGKKGGSWRSCVVDESVYHKYDWPATLTPRHHHNLRRYEY